jgi:hypothetical protein
MVGSLLALLVKLLGASCLTHVGREGWLADDVPIWRCFPEVAGKSLFELAVEMATLVGSSDWIARGENEIKRLTPHDTSLIQREAPARHKRWHDRRQGTAIQEGAAKKCVWARQLEARHAFTGWHGYRANETTQLRQPHEGSHASFGSHTDRGGPEKHRLGHRQVDPPDPI